MPSRPASGAASSCERVDDFPKVWASLEAEDIREEQGRERLFSIRRSEGVYEVTDYDVLQKVFYEILDELSADLLALKKADHLVFVEFARQSYVEAMGHFDREVLAQSLMIYMQVSFETCWERNVARHEAAVAMGGDDHLVPREAMERLYLIDDRDDFIRAMKARGIPSQIVDNEAEGEEHLVTQVENLFEQLYI